MESNNESGSDSVMNNVTKKVRSTGKIYNYHGNYDIIALISYTFKKIILLNC